MDEQSGGKINYVDNMFLNKDLYAEHFGIEYRKKRVNDFLEIYNKLRNNLFPTENAIINKNRMKKYINMHKKENRELIKKILTNTGYISFKNFYNNLKHQIKKYNNYLKNNNIKKYIYVIGVGNDNGSDITNFNLFKSNLWIFMLIYKYLIIKPYDICLNLNTAIRLHNKNINDYMLADDCSYSGDQVVNRVFYTAATEFLYKNKGIFRTNDALKKTMFKVVEDKQCNIHFVIPFLSKIAYIKINEIKLLTQLNIILYTSYIINPYRDIFDPETIRKINIYYQKFHTYVDFGNLIPIFFEHKIADSVSTIELILIKGQVLDNPDKKYVFVNACMYDKKNPNKKQLNPEDKNFILKKIYCPNPPYLEFDKILQS